MGRERLNETLTVNAPDPPGADGGSFKGAVREQLADEPFADPQVFGSFINGEPEIVGAVAAAVVYRSWWW